MNLTSIYAALYSSTSAKCFNPFFIGLHFPQMTARFVFVFCLFFSAAGRKTNLVIQLIIDPSERNRPLFSLIFVMLRLSDIHILITGGHSYLSIRHKLIYISANTRTCQSSSNLNNLKQKWITNSVFKSSYQLLWLCTFSVDNSVNNIGASG